MAILVKQSLENQSWTEVLAYQSYFMLEKATPWEATFFTQNMLLFSLQVHF